MTYILSILLKLTEEGLTDMACTSLQNVGVEKFLENADIGNLILATKSQHLAFPFLLSIAKVVALLILHIKYTSEHNYQ